MQWILEVMSGRRKGVAAALLRCFLTAAEPIYYCAVLWRNRRYNKGTGITKVEIPVVSVGNITTGGTGKTPMVQWLVSRLGECEQRVVIVSRGYGAEGGAQNDEAMELELSLPDVPHLQNPNRIEAAQVAIEELAAQCIVLDDGFQHRRLGRDLDIVLLDALEPFGYGHLLPRGLLREPLRNLRRAHWIGLSRADQVDEKTRRDIQEETLRWSPDRGWFEVIHRPLCWENATRQTQPMDHLENRPVVAFCGIGNPEGFRHTLSDLHLNVEQFHVFPDHHGYTRDDLEWLEQRASEFDQPVLVCTRKDLVKLGVDRIGKHHLWSLQIGIEFQRGESELLAAIQGVLGEPSDSSCRSGASP